MDFANLCTVLVSLHLVVTGEGPELYTKRPTSTAADPAEGL